MSLTEFQESIRAALRPRGSRLLRFADLRERVLGSDATPAAEKEEALRQALDDLERRGEIVRERGEKYSLIEFTSFRAGTLAVRGEARGFLLGPPDLPIAPGHLGGGMDGDFVLARLERPAAGARRGPRGRHSAAPREVGSVVRILVRRHETIVGKLVREADGTAVLVPFDSKIDARFRIPEDRTMEAADGLFIEARVLAFPDRQRRGVAEVVERIGFEGEPGVDIEVVARKWGLPRHFSNEALAEAASAVGEISAEERRERADYTGRTIVTIDGETARDFDDAIEAEVLEGGGFRIGIHIADVSHYVKPGSALDVEAYERGTSVYFPDRAISMLPERLSNDLCSLRPNEEKRTVSALITLDRLGEPIAAEFKKSVIRSRARLTYDEVASLLKSEKAPDEARVDASVLDMLKMAHAAARALRSRRGARGSLDFDLPDADLLLGETGDVVSIAKAVRNEAHRLIEEFMLAANEAVARHLSTVPMPTLYRIHERPEARKLADIRGVLEPLGYEIPEADEDVAPSIFQGLIDQAAGRPEERFVSELVLRSQKKALYSEECRGHYALAAPHYGHFTSPIRRYPDLLMHRALVEWLATRAAPGVDELLFRTATLKRQAVQCSSRERRAESAEREAVSWKKFVFLSGRVGEEFDAFVSSVVPFGLFITLNDVLADGLISMSDLDDDYYRYIEEEKRLVGSARGRVFRLGDPLKVRLIRADALRRALDFALVGSAAAAGGPSSRKPERGHDAGGTNEGRGSRSRKAGPKRSRIGKGKHGAPGRREAGPKDRSAKRKKSGKPRTGRS